MIRKNGLFMTQVAIQIHGFDSQITVLKVIGIHDSQKVLNRPSPTSQLQSLLRLGLSLTESKAACLLRLIRVLTLTRSHHLISQNPENAGGKFNADSGGTPIIWTR